MRTSMKQRASARIWDIIVTRQVATVPAPKQPSPEKEYTPKVYVSPATRKADKESRGIPTQSLDAEERRTRARVLRWRRQHTGG